jgi:hypothetical protein
MAKLVHLDETGSVGKGAKKQPLLTVAAVLVDEEQVRALAEDVREVAMKHLGWAPADLELHGHEIWQGQGYWKGKSPAELIAAYEAAVRLIKDLDIHVAFASIHKQRLHDKYGGGADGNAYLLAMQFVLEKIDSGYAGLKILIADEHKEQQLRAIKMVDGMQKWGTGEVPSRPLKTVIDSMHFVSSHASPGVQMADLVAYVLQRRWAATDTHPDAKAAIERLYQVVLEQTHTWREVWPAR